MVKVHKPQGGDQLVIEPGGTLTVGDVTITVAEDGAFMVAGLPTSDPEVVGQLWANSGVLTISAGP